MRRNRAYSEKWMTREFARAMMQAGPRSILPRQSVIVPEILTMQGIPDLIALEGQPDGLVKLRRLKEGDARILAVASARHPLTLPEIATKSRLTERTSRNTLASLRKSGLVIQSLRGKEPAWRTVALPDFDLWAFEIKRDKWRRALFQALQAQTYAAFACVVFPPEMKPIISKHLRIFKRFRVGVFFFDPRTGKVDMKLKPERSGTVKLQSYLYALSGVGRAWRRRKSAAVLLN